MIVVPEVHLLPEDIWKGDSWCRACGLKAVWAPAYREEGGGVQAGIAVTADASVGLEVHKATGGCVGSWSYGCKLCTWSLQGDSHSLESTYVVDKEWGGKML